MTVSVESLLTQALSFHQQGRLAQAIECCQKILQLQPASFDALHLMGVAFLQSGNSLLAVECISRAIAVNPSQPAAHSHLGNALQSLQRAEEALASYEQALRLAPDFVDALYNYGNILQQFQRDDEALASYDRALQLKPDYAGAWYNRGVLLHRLKQMELALASYDRALAVAPNYVFALNNRGVVLQALQQNQRALESYDHALQHKPDYAEAWNNRGNVLREMGRNEDALASYDQALSSQPGYAEAVFNRGGVLRTLARNAEALASYDQALQLRPAYFDALIARGDLLRDIGEKDSALECFKAAISLQPISMLAWFKHLMAQLPVFAVEEDEPDISRQAFAAELAMLQPIFAKLQLEKDNLAVGAVLPFYLAYQAHNNRDLLAQFGEMCCDAMARWQRDEQLVFSLLPAHGASRIRIGIISAHIQNQSVWQAIVKGWFQHLDKDRFELHVVFPETNADHETAVAKTLATSFEQGIKPLKTWVQSILSKQLDILIYPEFGMNPTTAQLACMRLAPVQIATWGHPETTGLPTMDYYLSAAAFEEENAQQNYSEQLICLPNLGCYYTPLEVTAREIDLGSLGIDSHRPVMICPGTLFKYQPQYDHVFVDIARRLGDVQFVFFTYHRVPELSFKLSQRIAKKFADAGLSYEHHARFIPWQNTSGFYYLMKHAHVMLDTIGFSGFNTAIQAVACDLPVVAYQGRFMRGKLASAVLKQMDMQAYIASNPSEYVDCAVRLVTDQTFADHARRQMQDSMARLYQDISVIRALEAWLVRLAGRETGATFPDD